mmetsp:Transcript_26292/g.69081  ORF Transcript_26292/g.69081 Transcript_26292/m.69081 type:complete len:205 (+) Transcript_26292:60-674(+)
MRELAVAERERVAQVRRHRWVARRSKDPRVHFLLQGSTLGVQSLPLVLLVVKDLALGTRGVRSAEEFVGERLGQSHLGDVKHGRGGNDVGRVDTLERDAVELERARHQDEPRRQRLQEDSALPLESPRQENADGARLEGLAELDRLLLCLLPRDRHIDHGVVSGLLGHRNNTGAAVLSSANLLLLGGRRGDRVLGRNRLAKFLV